MRVFFSNSIAYTTISNGNILSFNRLCYHAIHFAYLATMRAQNTNVEQIFVPCHPCSRQLLPVSLERTVQAFVYICRNHLEFGRHQMGQKRRHRHTLCIHICTMNWRKKENKDIIGLIFVTRTHTLTQLSASLNFLLGSKYLQIYFTCNARRKCVCPCTTFEFALL